MVGYLLLLLENGMSVDALTQAKSTLEGVRGALGIYSKTEVDMTLGMLDRAIAKYTALDAICQDLQEKTYTQAMRIAELEAKLSETEKQEPVAMQMDVIVVNLVREGINKHRARELAEHFIKHTHPQPKRETPKAGDGYDLFYEAVRLLDNAIFAQSGDVVRHDLAAHKEALDFFNHVFTKLDLTPSQPKREWVGLTTAEFDEIHESHDTLHDAMWATITKLKEKNT